MSVLRAALALSRVAAFAEVVGTLLATSKQTGRDACAGVPRDVMAEHFGIGFPEAKSRRVGAQARFICA